MNDIAELHEIPVPIVQLYAELMDRRSRAVVELEAARGRDHLRYLGMSHALSAIGHQLEGVALVWHALNGGRESSDDELRDAAQVWWAEHPR